MIKITLYTDEIYFEDKSITDKKEIAKTIKSHIAHLGEFGIYYEEIVEPKTFWGRVKRAFMY